MTIKIPAIHYDTRQFRDIVITGKVVDNMWIQTNKGLLPLAEIFPTALRDDIVGHFNRVMEARVKLTAIESGEMFQLFNQCSTWRRAL